MNILNKLLILGLATGAMACSDDDPTEMPPAPKVLTAATYNMGLALGFVEATQSRAPVTSDAVANLAVDVLCVQELWLDEHKTALDAATAESLPNKTYVDVDPGTIGSDGVCTAAETGPLQACIETNCNVCQDELVACALKENAMGGCADEVAALSPECFGCVGANLTETVDNIVDICMNGSREYLYGGSFGIGMLTNQEVLASDTLVMDSVLNRRGVVYNHLQTPIGEVHAFCTHLTAVFSEDSGIMYPGSDHASSFAEEQSLQIDAMHAWIDSKAAGGQVILMGDFNTGPAGDGYLAEVPDNYTKLVAGTTYGNPYIGTPGHTCTFCADNPIIARENADDDDSAVIDHVLIGGFPTGAGSAAATRILDQPIQVDNCGATIDSAYSDHYGVSVQFTFE